MHQFEDSLLKNLHTFTAFVRRRVGDPHLAEDLIQDSLVKALKSSRKPVGNKDTVTWFYQILRRSIVDLHRRNDARRRALERFEAELSETPKPGDGTVLCACVKRLLPALPAQYRELLQRMDLDGGDPDRVAAAMGVTRNNLAVRLHRARQRLRRLLSDNCRVCSRHGCLDCTCVERVSGARNA